VASTTQTRRAREAGCAWACPRIFLILWGKRVPDAAMPNTLTRAPAYATEWASVTSIAFQ